MKTVRVFLLHLTLLGFGSASASASGSPSGFGSGFGLGTHRNETHHFPSYMMRLYRSFSTNQTPIPTSSSSSSFHHYPHRDQDPTIRADMVRSVAPNRANFRDKNWTIAFDLSTLLSEHHVQAVELRIRVPMVTDHRNVTVELLHHQDRPCSRRSACVEDQSLGFLPDTSLISSSSHWKVYNVTAQLLDWMENNAPSQRRRKTKVKKEGHGRGRTPPGVRGVNIGANRALLVVFSYEGPGEGPQDKASLLRTAERSKFLLSSESQVLRRVKRQKGRRRNDRPERKSDEVEPTDRENQKKNLCRRVDMHVDFNQIGWGSWIIFPKKYNAFRCEGTCPNPLGEEFHPTNHAYMQSLLKHFHPGRVPSPCCAPIRTSALSMLYYENGEMILRHHEEMVVEECGCH